MEIGVSCFRCSWEVANAILCVEKEKLRVHGKPNCEVRFWPPGRSSRWNRGPAGLSRCKVLLPQKEMWEWCRLGIDRATHTQSLFKKWCSPRLDVVRIKKWTACWGLTVPGGHFQAGRISQSQRHGPWRPQGLALSRMFSSSPLAG